MTALHTLKAFEAARSGTPGGPAGRVLQAGHGLPLQVQEGARLCAYTWTAGELSQIIEPDGSRLDYRYGEDGRLLAVERNGQAWARYAYDAAGRLTGVDRADGPLKHQYDARGRLLRTERGDASPFVYRWANGAPGGQQSGNPASRVSEARSDTEHSRFEHDRAGRLVGLVQTVADHTLSLHFGFDAAGRLEQIHFAEWQQRIGFAWDARGRPGALSWNGVEVTRLGTDDAQHLSWHQGLDGVQNQTRHEPSAGRPQQQCLSIGGQPVWAQTLERDAAFRLVREGRRQHHYDAFDRLVETRDSAGQGGNGAGRSWRYRYDLDDNVAEDGDTWQLHCDGQGRVQAVVDGTGERIFRHNQAGELTALLHNGECIARLAYDHKGRLVQKTGPAGTERYVYGPDDALLAVADGAGRPRLILLRLPTGLISAIDFRHQPQGELLCLHHDHAGNLLFVGRDGKPGLTGPLAYDPWGLPLPADTAALPNGGSPETTDFPPIFRGRLWFADLGLYRIGCRWYDPALRRFLTPDSYTGAPDDARLINPFVAGPQQRLQRAQVLADWLRQPRLRNRHAYCANDPVNRFDPNGHWSFGGVLLSLLGVLWTLPNTAFGLAIEVSCLIGEVVRWLVYAFSLGHVSWQTPGFDVAASGRLNAFALVFKGGWLGSFDSLLGITFGNVIFVNGEYEQNAEFQALPETITPPAYLGQPGDPVTFPKAQALYEHELRHVNQYGWWGPFFHLGLPLFGIYEWDVILNGYQNASLEADARAHGGF